ncbi:GntR family transcriptional regulator [Streptomyces sp. NBC_01483]|uniref:GntR family transcriptional regulator n=1 Tax=Streptomyces sp. NBC_01483 TaxID=2903883 RepID=UPI002E3676E2|nr:GntR family transcriptional regulator [Streptomyces sp. NBC_01483]
MPRYREIADELREQIERGDLPPGSKLAHTTDLMARFDASKSTVRAAVDVLAQEGLVVARRRYGTVVRDRRTVRIPLSRYQGSLESNGRLGPFEAACAAQGLNGFMKTVAVERVRDPGVAALLRLDSSDDMVCRRREALIEDQVVQFQHAWYPLDVAEIAGLDQPGRIEGGVYRALRSAGIPAVEADERVSARMPTKEEGDQLGTGVSTPVLTIERISKDSAGRPLELLRVVAAGDRMELAYEALPLPGSEQT